MTPIAAHVAHHAASHPSPATGLLVLILAVALGSFWAGRTWTRRAALRHLGAAEFATRWAAVRRVSRW